MKPSVRHAAPLSGKRKWSVEFELPAKYEAVQITVNLNKSSASIEITEPGPTPNLVGKGSPSPGPDDKLCSKKRRSPKLSSPSSSETEALVSSKLAAARELLRERSQRSKQLAAEKGSAANVSPGACVSVDQKDEKTSRAAFAEASFCPPPPSWMTG